MRNRMLFLFFLLLRFSGAEIIDRIAVSVGNRVITESEIDREIRMTAFINGEKPDFSPDSKRKTADRLIEQKLIRKELELSRYSPPAPAEVETMLQQLKARFKTPAQYQQELQRYRISEEDLKDHLLWQLTTLRFIDVRFRQGVQVSNEEIQEIFDKQTADKWPRNSKITDETRDQIEQTLTDKRVDEQLDLWLKEARKRTPINVREEVFQ